jgi:hypothetical protein
MGFGNHISTLIRKNRKHLNPGQLSRKVSTTAGPGTKSPPSSSMSDDTGDSHYHPPQEQLALKSWRRASSSRRKPVWKLFPLICPLLSCPIVTYNGTSSRALPKIRTKMFLTAARRRASQKALEEIFYQLSSSYQFVSDILTVGQILGGLLGGAAWKPVLLPCIVSPATNPKGKEGKETEVALELEKA